MSTTEVCFNPLAGIRCFLTLSPHEATGRGYFECFNPLAGIRCFLTAYLMPTDTRKPAHVSIP